MPDPNESFSLLTLPFQHDLDPRTDPGSDAWLPWFDRLGREEGSRDARVRARARQKDDSWFFVPHVRELLYGGSLQIETPGRGPIPPVRRLTYAAESEPVLRWRHLPEEDFDKWEPFRVEVDWVDVALFPDRIGMLVLKLRIIGVPDIANLGQAIGITRVVQPPSTTVRRRTLFDLHAPTPLLETLRIDQGSDLSMFHLVDALLDDFASHARATRDDDVIQSFGEIFRGFTFAVSPAGSQDARRVAANLVVAENANDAAFRLADEELDRLSTDCTLRIWDGWRLVATADHSVMLVEDETWFTTDILPHNLESDYLWLWLLAFFQKVRLNRLAGDLVWPEDDQGRALELSIELTEDFLSFVNSYWFVDVTSKEQGQRIFTFLQRRLGTVAAFEAVQLETNQVRNHLQGEDARHTTAQVTLVTFVGLPLTLWLAAIAAIPNLSRGVAILLMALGVIVTLAAAVTSVTFRTLAVNALRPVQGFRKPRSTGRRRSGGARR